MSDSRERDTPNTPDPPSTPGTPGTPDAPSPHVDSPEPARDLPRLRRSETHLALQYAVTGVLAASATLSDAVSPLLETICGRLGWDMGVYWTVDREVGVLRCRGLWHGPSLDLSAFADLSRRTTFVPGEGLPGRVWAAGKPALIPDVVRDLGFPRASTAAAEGLHGAVAFPIVSGGVTQGVLEFFSRDVGDLSAELVEALTVLGVQIGQFIERTRSEDARREIEARRATMLETALDAIISMDHTGRVVEFNPSAERTFGYSRAEALGRELADLIIPAHLREQHRAGLARYLEVGHGPLIGRRMEVMAMRADGTLFPAELAITRVPLDGPPLFTGYIRDITERRQAEQALRESEETFRLLFASNPQPMWVYDLATLAFLEVNDAAVDRYGYTRDEFLAMRITEIRPEEDVPRVVEDVRGQRPTLQYAGEWRHRCKDGRLLDVEITSHTLTFAGRSAVLVTAQDVTERKRAEAALRVSEERLRTVVANAPVVLFAVDRNGVFTLSEGKGLESLGLQPGGHVGQSYFDLYGDMPDSVAAMRRALAGESATTLNRFKGLVFETRWMSTLEADGTVSGVIGVCADVTERTWIEEERAALLDRERQARAEAVARAAERDAVFEAMADGVFVCDQSGKTLRMNRAFREMLAIPIPRVAAYTAATLADRGELLVMRDADGQPLPKEQWPVSRLLRGEVLTGGQVEITVRTMDGHDVLMGVSGAPLYDGVGVLVGGVCICRDVTERRRWERRTHEALEALLAMAEALVQGDAGAHATEGDAARETEAVARRLVALTRSVLGCRRVSMTMYDAETGMVRPLAVVGVTADDESAWRSGQPGTALREYLDAALLERLFAEDVLVVDAADTRNHTLPYGIRTLLLALMRVGQHVVGVLSLDHGAAAHAYTLDEVALARAVAKLSGLVIERERLLLEREEARANEAALRESNRRMDAFLGIAGHEMRTPLTTIKGNLQLAHRRLGLLQHEEVPAATTARALDEARHLLDRTDAHMNRLSGLIDDLLDVSRIQAGRLELRRRPCDLAEIVRDVVYEQRDVAATRTIRLDTAEEETVPVEADAERIGQVVANYVSNALKYSSEDRPVTVGLRVEGRMASVWVHDEGPGLPDGEGERVWERFYQVAGTEHRHGSSVGLGMGLYISRTIVEQHGGAVGVESERGKGATFWFTLPVVSG